MKTRIWIAMIAVYIFWGSTYLAIRFAVQTMPPFLMAAGRFLLAGSILYVFTRLRGDPAPSRKNWTAAAVVGFFLLVGGNGGVVWAETRVASGVAALLVGAAPLWMVLLDAIRPGGCRPGWLTLAGVLVGFAGIALLINPMELSNPSHSLDPLGVAVLVFASILWAIGSLYNRQAALPESPLLGTGMEMLVGGAGFLLLGTLVGDWERLNLAQISAASWWGLAYLIVFGALIGFAAYTWLLRVAPTPLVSTYAYVNPLIAIFIGNWLAQEPLTPRILAAALIIVSAVALINLARPAPVKTACPETALSVTPNEG